MNESLFQNIAKLLARSPQMEVGRGRIRPGEGGPLGLAEDLEAAAAKSVFNYCVWSPGATNHTTLAAIFVSSDSRLIENVRIPRRSPSPSSPHWR